MSESYLQPAFEALSDDQLQELMDEHRRLSEVDGYLYLQPEWVRGRARIAVSVYFDSDSQCLVDLVPQSVAGLPVVVKMDDSKTGEIRIVRDGLAE